jgi:hypothetical protein
MAGQSNVTGVTRAYLIAEPFLVRWLLVHISATNEVIERNRPGTA